MSQFIGREAELARLRADWEIASGGVPRLVVLAGDSGLGKTRLAQELYRWLSTQRDPENYWPDAFRTPRQPVRQSVFRRAFGPGACRRSRGCGGA